MRLKQIRISGFKTFCEPMELAIDDDLVGVVGPNGCGKSNIIDAIVWVMGESSARQLRTEKLSDVIFNGASGREPLGQASVELMFDNSAKKIALQYDYNEISIKRTFSRDGVSRYFLNNVACRRRDITRLFLGTGLGPRSYAILEQGMVARLVEANPEELRVFIEEAAGVSKYQDRRVETAQRIRHTQDNINQLKQTHKAEQKQLQHLKKQADTANQYKKLKSLERQLQAEEIALNWRDLNQDLKLLNQNANNYINNSEKTAAVIAKIDADLTAHQTTLEEHHQQFNGVQSNYYHVASNIAAYEHEIKAMNEQSTTLKNELNKNQNHYEEEISRCQGLTTQLETLQLEMSALESKLASATDNVERGYQSLENTEQIMSHWQSQWDEFNQSFMGLSQNSQLVERDLKQTHQELETLEIVRQSLLEEQESLAEISADDLSVLEDELQNLESDQSRYTKEHETVIAKLKKMREQHRDLSDKFNDAKHRYQSMLKECQILDTIVQQSTNAKCVDWLNHKKFQPNKTLAEMIEVEQRWLYPLETVLGDCLKDIGIGDFSEFLSILSTRPDFVYGSFFHSRKAITVPDFVVPSEYRQWSRLVDYIHSDVMLPDMLQYVFVADDLDEAYNKLATLTEGYSIITPDGIWLSPSRIFISSSADHRQTFLIHRQRLNTLIQNLTVEKQQLHVMEQDFSELVKQLDITEKKDSHYQEIRHQKQQDITALHVKLASMQEKYSQSKGHKQRVAEEFEQNAKRISETKMRITDIESQDLKLKQELARLSQQKEDLSKIGEAHRQEIMQARKAWQRYATTKHETELRLSALQSRSATCKQSIAYHQQQQNTLQQQSQDILARKDSLSAPLDALHKRLDSSLDEKIKIETTLNDIREKIQDIENKIRHLEQQRYQNERQHKEEASQVEDMRLQRHEYQIRLDVYTQQLEKYEYDLETLLATLDAQAQIDDWRQKCVDIQKKIERLGAVNMAAIDEVQQYQERMHYYESQCEDLNRALTSLHDAMRKIDKKTQALFKNTFDQINQNIGVLFPQLFGGGAAYLELTSDDLLQTGVTITARPAGKRNSNIRSLSGGEKAMTAVAFLIAIFKLNPAPFCIMDEIDASFDDTNAMYFSELLKSMVGDIQFIFITHNKITMSIAQQLIGVTMNESGISRLVSVDMESAMTMIDSHEN